MLSRHHNPECSSWLGSVSIGSAGTTHASIVVLKFLRETLIRHDWHCNRAAVPQHVLPWATQLAHIIRSVICAMAALWENRGRLPMAPRGLGEAEASSLFENTFCLDFVITYDMHGEVQTRELCAGGKDSR